MFTENIFTILYIFVFLLLLKHKSVLLTFRLLFILIHLLQLLVYFIDKNYKF